MPSASRSTTPVGIDLPIVEGRYAELDDHTVAFETFKQDVDVTRTSAACPATSAAASTSATFSLDSSPSAGPTTRRPMSRATPTWRRRVTAR